MKIPLSKRILYAIALITIFPVFIVVYIATWGYGRLIDLLPEALKRQCGGCGTIFGRKRYWINVNYSGGCVWFCSDKCFKRWDKKMRKICQT